MLTPLSATNRLSGRWRSSRLSVASALPQVPRAQPNKNNNNKTNIQINYELTTYFCCSNKHNHNTHSKTNNDQQQIRKQVIRAQPGRPRSQDDSSRTSKLVKPYQSSSVITQGRFARDIMPLLSRRLVTTIYGVLSVAETRPLRKLCPLSFIACHLGRTPEASEKGEVLLRGVGTPRYFPHQMHRCSGSLMVRQSTPTSGS